MKPKIYSTIAFSLFIVLCLSTCLKGQENTVFRTMESEQTVQRKNLEAHPTQFPFHKYLSKNNRLILQNESADACLSYQIYYTCTPSNLYENFKSSKTEGIFYSFDDKGQKISSQFKKVVDNVEVKIFSTLIFSENHIISIHFTTCMEQIKTNMNIFQNLIGEYAAFTADCQNKGNRQFK